MHVIVHCKPSATWKIIEMKEERNSPFANPHPSLHMQNWRHSVNIVRTSVFFEGEVLQTFDSVNEDEGHIIISLDGCVESRECRSGTWSARYWIAARRRC
jgi:hypothetical protein